MNHWDVHMHTHHSGDSEAPMEAMIQAAIAKGLQGICFTDHLDYDYLPDPELFLLDGDAYYKEYCDIQKRYEGILPIRFGVEVGLQPHIVASNNAFVCRYPFDFVIGSSHVAHGVDPYYPEYYEGRSEHAAYLEYFEAELENAQSAADYDVYGHLDYVVRYGPNQNRDYSYQKYADIIDEILRALIAKGRGLEVNTAGLTNGLGHPNPTEDILKRYRELGGEILTTGADAHVPENVGSHFEVLHDMLTACGFSYYTVFKQRKPEFIRL